MTEILPAPDADNASGVSRRSMILAVAWSTPVIAIATASPARAVSVTPPIDPLLITLDVHKVATQHGFVIRNTSSQLATALVSFTADSAGEVLGEAAARANLILATDIDSANYIENATGGATAAAGTSIYQALWNDDISYVDPRASRTGQMSFDLPAGSSLTFYQLGLVAFGAPRITGTVTSIATAGGPLTPVSGDFAEFTLP